VANASSSGGRRHAPPPAWSNSSAISSGPGDDWSPTTAIRSSPGHPAQPPAGRAAPGQPPARRDGALPPELDPRGRRVATAERARAAAAERAAAADRATAADRGAATSARAQAAPRAPERGLPGWAALGVLLAITAAGGIVDVITGAQVRGGFNYGIVIASAVAILAVRRSSMFPIVIAPPLVYSVGSGIMLYVRSSGGHNRKVLFDAAINWLVYGFPAIAAATAIVLIVAGIRLLTRR
jgi:hypothetical protein